MNTSSLLGTLNKADFYGDSIWNFGIYWVFTEFDSEFGYFDKKNSGKQKCI